MDKEKKLNPQIKLDRDPENPPMHDPNSPDFEKPEGWTREEISFYFDKALKVLNNDNFTTAKEYVDLLTNQCLAEKHWSDAFSYFLKRIQEMGLQVETDQDKYQSLSDRLFHWRTVRMMIHAAGLGAYEEEILKYEIGKYYQPPPNVPPPKMKEVLVGRTPRRQPTQSPPKPSILNPGPQPRKPVTTEPRARPGKGKK